MSDTLVPPNDQQQPAPAAGVPSDPWTKPIQLVLSVGAQLMLAVALALSYVKGDANTQTLIIGAVIANSSLVFSYWLGSSSGSARKTEQLGQQSKG